MQKPVLVIGEKNYSTWSMRPWVFMRDFGIAFSEQTETLQNSNGGLRARLLQHSPAARVPVLKDGETRVWDSLAICLYAAEKYLQGGGLPKARAARARALALVCEMHSGFAAMRGELHMNIRARRRVNISQAAARDIARVNEIWQGAGGGWLCGEFSLADCFFAPVAMRFLTYPAAAELLGDKARDYGQRLRARPSVVAWQEAAAAETNIVQEDETGEEIAP